MGAFFPGRPRDESSSFGRPVCSEVGECPAFRCLCCLRGLCLCPSRQQGSRSLTCFYWPCRLSPSPGGSVWFGGLMVIPFTWAFMCWPSTHGGSLAAVPEVGLLGRGCWHIVRVPQNLCLTPLPGVRSMLLFLALRYGRCSRQRHFHVVMESSPTPGQGLSISAFKGGSSALKAFSFWSVGTSRSPE